MILSQVEFSLASLNNPEENWAVFKNVYEPIIDRETFEPKAVLKIILYTPIRADGHPQQLKQLALSFGQRRSKACSFRAKRMLRKTSGLRASLNMSSLLLTRPYCA